MYIIAGVVLIVVVVLGAFLMLGGRQRQSQLDAASPILAQIGQDTQALSSSWNKAKSQIDALGILEMTDDPTILSNAIDKSTDNRALLSEIKDELDSVSVYQSKIDSSLQDLKELELPSWVQDYVGLMESMLAKDKVRLGKALQLVENANRFYAFSEPFAKGKLADIAMDQNLSDGRDKFEAKDYAGAAEAFDQALSQNSQVETYADDAQRIIAMTYLDKAQANRVEGDALIKEYQRVLGLANAGSYQEANQQYQEAEKAYESLLGKRVTAADTMPENEAWWDAQVGSLQNELGQLTAEIETLQHQAQALVEQNKR